MLLELLLSEAILIPPELYKDNNETYFVFRIEDDNSKGKMSLFLNLNKFEKGKNAWESLVLYKVEKGKISRRFQNLPKIDYILHIHKYNSGNSKNFLLFLENKSTNQTEIEKGVNQLKFFIENIDKIFCKDFRIASIIKYLVEKLNFKLIGIVLCDCSKQKVASYTKEPLKKDSVKVSSFIEIPIYILDPQLYCQNEKLCLDFLKRKILKLK